MSGQEILNHYFIELEDQNKFSGNVLVIRGNSKLFQKSYGYASRSWKIQNEMNIRFDTASITKLFTSIAVLQLIDQGKLSFDTSAIDFLEIDKTTISKEVTIYHLLTHTSGIGDDVEEEDGEDYADLWKTRPNYCVLKTADFLPQFIHKPPNFAPGEGCRFCNCSFILLGLMIEKISGISFRDFVRRHIFRKAAMHQTDFLSMELVNENVAEGSDPILDENGSITGWKKNIYSFPPIGSPDSGVLTTVSDLDRFLRSVQSGELLSPELTETFLTPQVNYLESDEWKTMYGTGLMFYLDKSNEVVCYQKDGINAGVSGIIRYFPNQDINVVILSNMASGVWKPIWKIHEMIIDGLLD